MKQTLTPEQLEVLWDCFLSLGQAGLSMNHYDLESNFQDIPSKTWRTFLQLPEVIKHIEEEFEIIKNSELKKMINNSANTNSVGRAQLMNALAKTIDGDSEQADGPVFIYTYVPLSSEQAFAPNVQKETSDIFDPTKDGGAPQWITSANSDPTI